jgi:exonuclease SbcC
MIKSIRLKNWKCHLDSYLEFSEGTNCLLGVMGAGKTSILEAISYALFGTFPQLQQKKVKLEDIIMKKPVRKDYAEVELEFVLDGKRYQVKRRIERRKASSAELRIDGKLVEAQPQRVTEFIEDVLKIDFDLFTRAIYSEQNKIESFLTIPKGQRMKRIDEVLKLDRFETARASVVSLINRAKTMRNDILNILQQLKAETDVQVLQQLKAEVKKLEAETRELRSQKTKLFATLKEKEEKYKELSNLRERIEKLRREIEKLEGMISVLEKEVEKEQIEDSASIRKRIEELEQILAKKRGLLEEINSQIKKLSQEHEDAAIALREIQNSKKR